MLTRILDGAMVVAAIALAVVALAGIGIETRAAILWILAP